jgi:RNA polymerase sigma-70 factor (ECF subfamily)
MRPWKVGLRTLDQSEFGARIESYRRELHVHCYRMVGSIHDAEDMVQETFLRAWRRRETVEAPSSLRPWLYTIATHVCLDALKRYPKRYVPRSREAESTLGKPIPQEIAEPIWLEPYPDVLLRADDDRNPEERVAVREDITLAFIVALHRLPPRQRAVLLLREVLGWKASEVAALLQTTVSAVKSALHRAQATLADHGYAPDAEQAWALDDAAQSRLNAYVRAWEAADIASLIRLLHDDVTFSMPPIPSWYRGKETVRALTSITVFNGRAQGRWRLLPTRANRQPAFGVYRQAEVPGLYQAYGIQLLTFHDHLIRDITTFRGAALFPYFAMPLTIEASSS